MMVESDRHAGYPRDTEAGNPPHMNAATRSSISRENGSTTQPQHGSRLVSDEMVKAARCQLMHGDPYQSPEVSDARKRLSDLIGRSWKAEREMTRDERRLMVRYRKSLAAGDADTIAAYRACPRCSGAHTNGD